MTQKQIKNKVQDAKRMYFHYLKMSETNDSKFVKQWIEDYRNEHSELLKMVEDNEWVNKYGILNFYNGKYIN